MTKIYCVKNKGYKWLCGNGINFKGYFVSCGSEKHVIRGQSAINFFSSILSFDSFLDRLKEVDGVFSVICIKGKEIWAAVDIARSMPIYFSCDGKYISDSSEQIRKELKIQKDEFDPLRALEMINSTFVAHNNTIYKQIKQIDLGEAVQIVNNNINVQKYYSHYKQNIKYRTKIDAKKELQRITEETFDNIIKIIDNRPIVLSLSGGYDSRYVACMLKSRGIQDVSCYTYGSRSSFETKQSETVAKALGYRWACVEYTDEKIIDIISDKNFLYFDYCNEHDFTIYLQNFIAVKELHKNNWFSPNSVFLTGLCNDMPTGAYVEKQDKINQYPITNQGVAKYIFEKRFVRYKFNEESSNALIDEINSKINLNGINVLDYESFIKAADCIITGYDHSRRFLPMNQIHAFLGYEWLLPCWNKELLGFWYSLPSEYRIGQNLYEEWLTKDLCVKYGLGTRKILLKHSRFSCIVFLKRIIGGQVAKLYYLLGITVRRKTDQNNFAPLEVLLYKKIKQKKHINFKRAAITLLFTFYIMEKRYGLFCEKIDIQNK